MAQITLTIDDAIATRVLDAFTAETGWTPASGVTKIVWAKAKLAEYIKGIVVSHEAGVAGTTAHNAQEAASIVEINIT